MIRANLRSLRFVVAILSVAFCLFLIQISARIGFSRLIARYALVANSIPAADEAVRLTPSDPDAHRTRATILNRLRMPAEARDSLEAATSLRYRDDYLWLELGQMREDLGDTAGALAAFDQAVRRAPHYAHTHWQRGNVLLRMGRTAEAFTELRQAAAANRKYSLNLMDLAWSISAGDVKRTEELIEINDDAERLAFIRFLAAKGKGKESLDQIKLLSTPLSSENKNEFARLLFAAKAFPEAFDLWAKSPQLRRSALFNSGFEDPLVLNQAGFGGWILSSEQTKNKLAIDVSEKFGGARSLQITFGGDWTPGTPLLSQTILVAPGKTYPVAFSIKTKDLVTGGPPMITVSDAGSDQLLGKSESFPSTNSWVTLNFEFTTLATSEAAVIRLQRSNCNSSPCPIFGTLWLDEISIGPWKHASR